jgi:rhamnose transport system permease protein
MREFLLRYRWETVLAAILVGVFIVNVSVSPFYLGTANFGNMFQLSIEKVIVAVVMAFVIINGEIDLSVASVMGFSAAVVATLHDNGVAFELAIVVAVLAGAFAGLVHGFFVAVLGLPSLVVTLAGLIGWRGVARILVEDRSIGGFPDWFDELGQQPLFGRVYFATLLLFIGIVLAGILLHKTAFGRSVFVIGNNADVARYSGLSVRGTKLWLLTASGTVAGVAGVLYAARLGNVRGDIALGFELDIITMVLLGGVSIFGGSGTMVGVALSILIVLNLRNGLGLANVEANTQTGIIGAILIASVVLPNLVSAVAGRARGALVGRRSPPAVSSREGGDAAVRESDARTSETP